MQHLNSDAYIITGPTAGIGWATAMRMAPLGTLVLVGRNRSKLDSTKRAIEVVGGNALTITCDLSDLMSVRKAASEITALNLRVVGLLNNAGIQNPSETRTVQGWDTTFVTNHLGPFALTEALLPHLQKGASVLFVGSATEDPDRGPARRAGFRGGRYLSAEASLRGIWVPGKSDRPGMDAYATSKQCNIVTAMVLARENPHLCISALEPGIIFDTGLHAHQNRLQAFVFSIIATLLRPFIRILSTPKKAANVITKIMTDSSGATGMYYNESGGPMQGSELIRDVRFQERVVLETRALLASL